MTIGEDRFGLMRFDMGVTGVCIFLGIQFSRCCLLSNCCRNVAIVDHPTVPNNNNNNNNNNNSDNNNDNNSSNNK